MNRKSKGKISYTLQAINIIPLLFLGIFILVLGSHFFTEAMHAEVKQELRSVASNVIAMFDIACPGDYELLGETSYRLHKGGIDITNDYRIIDRVKEDTGLEVTLFYQDTRILTTIQNASGARIIGTGAPEIVLKDVLTGGEPHFYDNAMINGSTYFSYYVPLCNEDGSIVGILFVGKPRKEVDKAVQRSLYPLILAILVTLIIMSVCISRYMNSVVSVLLKIKNFLFAVSAGDLGAELSEDVLVRNDELGDIGHSILTMQRSLRNMVEQDALTALYNRRSADRKLHQIIQKSAERGTPFSLAIGDIDYFKKINDTYGHDCGDIVLKQVAALLKEHMRKEGFAARWGGEEFLLVFDHSDKEAARHSLESLLDSIRSLKIPYDGQTIRLTMTIGLAGGSETDFNVLIRKADDRLYEGKSQGRNRIIA